MDEYISFCSSREERWTGHPSKLGVRRAIEYAEARGRSLVIFAVDHGPAGPIYYAVPEEEWGREFAA
ncbi:hypothetical protein ACFV1L_10485 [Kitasatospora sp. NPDC059646]|uniref:hypothetical protein n=1 Tax=Kitasatospora sp. NPDC059646 TaxID=3346893 RepID=UPI0036BBB4B5